MKYAVHNKQGTMADDGRMVDKLEGNAVNSMTCEGCHAKINFDERGGIFWGKVIGIRDSITFEGETVAQLMEDFQNAIGHYLADFTKQNLTADAQKGRAADGLAL